MKEQNFKNHSRLVPLFHFTTLGFLLTAFICSIINLIKCVPGNCLQAFILTFLSFGTILVALFSRSFALKAQDRAIRAEENFRYFLATGKPFPATIQMKQIIALRFASDEEFVSLTNKAVAENMLPKDIKISIKNWKGDYNRL